ncbi:hypothetical protein LQ318_14110 [Aliifodinibius salicampi]|uniref:Uncharacterized protein n=1 Tax=Fodinibius salicampi TaxID=1920655 RepID=A0ABT3Q1Q7_9BACT|nr:hypothetical protein [Fodinibius salicampi]MCW9714042.1 hypothetical protein [Fodinibius salicampi]
MQTPDNINSKHSQNFFSAWSNPPLALLFILLVSLSFSNIGCDSLTGSDAPDQTYEYQFDEEPGGWSALFSNYSVGREDDFELESGYRSLPAPLDTGQEGFYLSGQNLSDDLNMFLKHRISGLQPETTYEVSLDVSFATAAPSGCVGAGGPPGEGVTVHVDASGMEPGRIVDDSRDPGFYRLNLAEEYEGEAQSWYQATEIGDVANSRECEEGWGYEIKTVTGGTRTARTDAEGNLWLLAGTRSGFEATTSLYYTEVKVNVWE